MRLGALFKTPNSKFLIRTVDAVRNYALSVNSKQSPPPSLL